MLPRHVSPMDCAVPTPASAGRRQNGRVDVQLVPWTDADLALLRRTNTPELTRYLGGPEPDEALVERHAEYLAGRGGARMFRVVADGAAAGYAGWWEQEHQGEPAFEIGCVVEPSAQGRGVASAALGEVVRRAIAEGDGRPIVGYGDIANEASARLCRRLGFDWEGSATFPAENGGEPMRVNVWVIRPMSEAGRMMGVAEGRG